MITVSVMRAFDLGADQNVGKHWGRCTLQTGYSNYFILHLFCVYYHGLNVIQSGFSLKTSGFLTSKKQNKTLPTAVCLFVIMWFAYFPSRCSELRLRDFRK